MRILIGATIVFVVSNATLLAQDQIVDPTTLPMSEVASGLFIDDNFMPVPPMPTTDSDFQGEIQSQMLEANRNTFQNNAGAIMPPSPSLSIQVVPEPSTLALGGLAFAFVAIAGTFKKQRKSLKINS